MMSAPFCCGEVTGEGSKLVDEVTNGLLGWLTDELVNGDSDDLSAHHFGGGCEGGCGGRGHGEVVNVVFSYVC